MARFVLTAAVVIVAALTAGSARVHACSCAVDPAPCSRGWMADAVFVGDATAIEQLTEPEMWGSRRITFVVREAFKGVEGRLVDVLTGSGGGDCGFSFGVGSTYLVYAHRHPTTGRLNTGICSSTALLDRSSGNLKLLRTPARQLEQPALVHGRATRSDLQSIRTPRVNKPFAGARVRLVGKSGSWESVTRHSISQPRPRGSIATPDDRHVSRGQDDYRCRGQLSVRPNRSRRVRHRVDAPALSATARHELRHLPAAHRSAGC